LGVNLPKQNKFLKWAVAVVIVLVVILAGLYIYQIIPRDKPTPTPSPTIPAWQDKSEKNVNSFLDYWLKSIGTTNSDSYAAQAKAYLTVSAQAGLATLTDSNGQVATKASDQLTIFAGGVVPKSYSITNVELIDELTTEVSVSFNDSTKLIANKIFTVKSVSGNWLIDGIRNWGTN
jgi:hypothetical protein